MINDPARMSYNPWPGQRSSKVTGVKKVIFTKNASSPKDHAAWSCNLCMFITLTYSTNVIRSFFYPRSFGVARSNSKVKFPKIFKNKVLLHNRRYGHVTYVCEVCTHHICQLCSLSWSEVKWGHRGQKVIFTQNATSPSLYVLWSCNSSIWSVYSTLMPLVLL